MPKDPVSKASAGLEIKTQGADTLVLAISGRLDSYSAAGIWGNSLLTIEDKKPAHLIVDASGIDYCDSSGISLLLDLERKQTYGGGDYRIEGLREEYGRMLGLYDYKEFKEDPDALLADDEKLLITVGKNSYSLWEEIKVHVEFTGRMLVALVQSFKNPSEIRWREVLITSEKFGSNAIIIIALVNFLVGLVIAFQSAIPMRQYGADIFVANLVAIAYFKELGPLMTAFVVNGRSGSAFAAELGTMKINEEIDALTTMGLDPVKFLIVPKAIAALLMLPLLTLFGNLFGLLGGLVVMLSLGYTFVTFYNQVTASATYVMLLAGLFKTLFFALIIAGVGCLSGMRASKGPSAVGDAATTAVVTGIILVILVDGLFGVLYYILGV